MKLLAVLAGALVAAATLTTSAVAFAQEAPVDNQIVQITTQKACGTVTVTLVNKDTGEYGFTWNTVPGNGGSVGIKSGNITVGSNKTETQTIHFAEDSYDGVGAFTLGAIYGPNKGKQQSIDIYPVDTNCGGPDADEPPATTAPSATPTPTVAPSPSADPIVEPAPTYVAVPVPAQIDTGRA